MSDDQYEANALFKLFQGEKLYLGMIKKIITLETPFVYHARALKVLEDAMKIIDVELPVGEKRNRGTFLALVPMSIYERDAPNRKYGNQWEVKFASEAVGEAVAPFLMNPSKNWASLKPWIEEMLAEGRRNFEELRKGLGFGNDGRRITAKTPLKKALEEMIKNCQIQIVTNLRGEIEYCLV